MVCKDALSLSIETEAAATLLDVIASSANLSPVIEPGAMREFVMIPAWKFAAVSV
jgi:hypothetical protein